jgi:hypothetical protein
MAGGLGVAELAAVSSEERVGRLEGGYERLATTADFGDSAATTQAIINDLHVLPTAAVGQNPIRTMHLTVQVVGAVSGVLVAVD